MATGTPEDKYSVYCLGRESWHSEGPAGRQASGVAGGKNLVILGVKHSKIDYTSEAGHLLVTSLWSRRYLQRTIYCYRPQYDSCRAYDRLDFSDVMDSNAAQHHGEDVVVGLQEKRTLR